MLRSLIKAYKTSRIITSLTMLQISREISTRLPLLPVPKSSPVRSAESEEEFNTALPLRIVR